MYLSEVGHHSQLQLLLVRTCGIDGTVVYYLIGINIIEQHIYFSIYLFL